MASTDHIKQYSAADIQRYLEGKMLPAEMHALEQAALDDPFLADAIEGLQQTLAQQDASLVDTDLQELGQKLEERVGKNSSRPARVIAFSWWKAAAAAIIVVTGSIWGYNAFQSNEAKSRVVSQQLAVVKQVPRPDSNIVPEPAAAAEFKSIAADTAVDHSFHFSPNADVSSNKNEDALRTENRPLPQLAPKKTILPDVAATQPNQPAATREELTSNLTKDNASSAFYDKKQVVVGNATLPDSIKAGLDLQRQFKADNSALVKSNKPADNQARNFNYYSNTLDKVYKSKADYEQIIVGKAARDTNAIGFYTKPRELEMNRSRKDLSERQAKKNPNALLSGFISGRVTDQANNPLSNALLRVEDNRDFFTDQKGQFKIPVKDSVVNIAIGYTGYYTQNLQLLNNSRDNNISLNQLGVKAPNPLLNESAQKREVSFDDTAAYSTSATLGIVNTNLGKFSKAKAQNAQPVYGWLEYQQYLDKNKQLPAGTPELKGSVAISFQVSKKGVLSDFKVEQSLGKAYDEEAIRLIKAGPSWKLTSGRKAKATVVINF
jgi:hypothetical protein